MADTVIITGGSRGIGAATVRLFAAKGWNVAFIYKSSHEAAEKLAHNTGTLAICGDVSDLSVVKSAFETVVQRFGTVDALVNNAGISLPAMIQDVSESDFDRVFSINVKGQFMCIQAALPYMLTQKRGSIVNISSMWGQTGGSCEVVYSASKAAVIGMTRAMAKELGPSGIRVNCVAPGVIDTEMNSNLTPADMAALADETPLGRIGTPDDIARAIYFLASDDSSFTTGQVFGINGGMVV